MVVEVVVLADEVYEAAAQPDGIEVPQVVWQPQGHVADLDRLQSSIGSRYALRINRVAALT